MNRLDTLPEDLHDEELSSSMRVPDLQSDTPSSTFSLECSLAADTRRIFDALTLPEYIETWLSIPGHHAECRTMTFQVGSGFEIQHLCRTGAATRIIGKYLSFHKKKLRFSWRQVGVSGAQESYVDIRLYGDFEKSILRLRHFGLDSEEDFHWHATLWSASIAKLGALFGRATTESPRAQNTSGRTRDRSPL